MGSRWPRRPRTRSNLNGVLLSALDGAAGRRAFTMPLPPTEAGANFRWVNRTELAAGPWRDHPAARGTDPDPPGLGMVPIDARSRTPRLCPPGWSIRSGVSSTATRPAHTRPPGVRAGRTPQNQTSPRAGLTRSLEKRRSEVSVFSWPDRLAVLCGTPRCSVLSDSPATDYLKGPTTKRYVIPAHREGEVSIAASLLQSIASPFLGEGGGCVRQRLTGYLDLTTPSSDHACASDSSGFLRPSSTSRTGPGESVAKSASDRQETPVRSQALVAQQRGSQRSRPAERPFA
jgi:hypothetical protein